MTVSHRCEFARLSEYHSRPVRRGRNAYTDAKITSPMFSRAMLWKWPTIHIVLWITASKTIVALMTPWRPATSQLTIAAARNFAAGVHWKSERQIVIDRL